MRVALVYDRLNKIGGAEQVLQAFYALFPSAHWYTSVWDKQRAPFSRHWVVKSSFISNIVALRTRHEWIPFLMPFIFESFDFRDYDLVISIGSAESKGIITKPGTVHIHYCLTPTRYLYSHKEEYLSNPPYRFIGNILRRWDQVAAIRPDEMIAISTLVKNRIKKYYNRESDIIFPPVDISKLSKIQKYTANTLARTVLAGDYFLTVSRLVPYKKIDVLIRAANQVKENLIVVGLGSEYKYLKGLAGPTVKILGHVSDLELIGYYEHCKAFLHAGEEDFGISMVEAQALGKPVIAYGVGGAVDIVIPGKTGILLENNSVKSFVQSLSEFDTMTFNPSVCRDSAKRFDKLIWQKQIKERISNLCQEKKK